MIYILMAIAGLLIIVALFTFIFRKKGREETERVIPEAGCCGAHAVCEKGLRKLETPVEYFEDEELDAFREIAPDAYTDAQLEMFRDVLYTLRPEEIESWLISLEKRGIAFPDFLKAEVLDLMEK